MCWQLMYSRLISTNPLVWASTSSHMVVKVRCRSLRELQIAVTIFMNKFISRNTLSIRHTFHFPERRASTHTSTICGVISRSNLWGGQKYEYILSSFVGPFSKRSYQEFGSNVSSTQVQLFNTFAMISSVKKIDCSVLLSLFHTLLHHLGIYRMCAFQVNKCVLKCNSFRGFSQPPILEVEKSIEKKIFLRSHWFLVLKLQWHELRVLCSPDQKGLNRSQSNQVAGSFLMTWICLCLVGLVTKSVPFLKVLRCPRILGVATPITGRMLTVVQKTDVWRILWGTRWLTWSFGGVFRSA